MLSRLEQRLLQLRGQIDSSKKHVERLERSVTHHRSKLQTCLENRDKKLAEVTQLENEYRLLTDFKLSPSATPVLSAHVSPVQSDCESEGENAMEMEGPPPESSSLPVRCVLDSWIFWEMTSTMFPNSTLSFVRFWIRAHSSVYVAVGGFLASPWHLADTFLVSASPEAYRAIGFSGR